MTLCVVCIAAHADTLTLNAVLDEHAILTGGISGSLTLDQASGLITGSDFSAGTNFGRFDFANAPISQTTNNGLTELVFVSSGNNAQLNLDILDAGIGVCSIQKPCNGQIISQLQSSGTSSAVEFGALYSPTISSLITPTPEPSTLLLVSGGLPGAALILRRKVQLRKA